MKTNKAPKKIYIQSFNVSEEEAKFDKSKLFFDDIWVEEPELGEENIEYTRTDTFIEKAAQWLKENLLNHTYVHEGEVGIGMAVLLEEFKQTMKEE